MHKQNLYLEFVKSCNKDIPYLIYKVSSSLDLNLQTMITGVYLYFKTVPNSFVTTIPACIGLAAKLNDINIDYRRIINACKLYPTYVREFVEIDLNILEETLRLEQSMCVVHKFDFKEKSIALKNVCEQILIKKEAYYNKLFSGAVDKFNTKIDDQKHIEVDEAKKPGKKYAKANISKPNAQTSKACDNFLSSKGCVNIEDDHDNTMSCCRDMEDDHDNRLVCCGDMEDDHDNRLLCCRGIEDDHDNRLVCCRGIEEVKSVLYNDSAIDTNRFLDKPQLEKDTISSTIKDIETSKFRNYIEDANKQQSRPNNAIMQNTICNTMHTCGDRETEKRKRVLETYIEKSCTYNNLYNGKKECAFVFFRDVCLLPVGMYYSWKKIYRACEYLEQVVNTETVYERDDELIFIADRIIELYQNEYFHAQSK